MYTFSITFTFPKLVDRVKDVVSNGLVVILFGVVFIDGLVVILFGVVFIDGLVVILFGVVFIDELVVILVNVVFFNVVVGAEKRRVDLGVLV
jgi:hypothetical protein